MAIRTTALGERSGGTGSGNHAYERPALMRGMLLGVLLWCALPIAAHATECNRAMANPVMHVVLPGRPFAALSSKDGCWLFASLSPKNFMTPPAVAVLNRVEGVVKLKRTVKLPGSPTGMVMTHDGSVLIVATGAEVVFFDIEQLTKGEDDAVLGRWREGHEQPGSIYVAVTGDDHYLFVSNEAVGTISMVDLRRTRRSRFAQIRLRGTVAVGSYPVGLALSSSGRFLFATVQSVDDMDWVASCMPEDGQRGVANHPEGAVVVIDLKLAVSDPGRAVLKRVPARCNPVRVVTSRQSGRVYVTARGSSELLMFHERDLTDHSLQPLATRVAVGTSPVGVAVIDDGRKVVVANSGRFRSDVRPSLCVLDSARFATSQTPVLGSIPSRGFPRELRVTPDGQTLLATNFGAGTLEIVDLRRAPWNPAPADEQQPSQQPRPTLFAGLASVVQRVVDFLVISAGGHDLNPGWPASLGV
jgi:DNA-binding beta-propeller fold protein YncE